MIDHPPDTVHDGTVHDGAGADDRQEAQVAFVARLGDIESLPLASRAEAFGDVHDELRAVLEGTTGEVGRGGR